ncbi:hypothetical protein ABK040_014776 [Willaertia magna]
MFSLFSSIGSSNNSSTNKKQEENKKTNCLLACNSIYQLLGLQKKDNSFQSISFPFQVKKIIGGGEDFQYICLLEENNFIYLILKNNNLFNNKFIEKMSILIEIDGMTIFCNVLKLNLQEMILNCFDNCLENSLFYLNKQLQINGEFMIKNIIGNANGLLLEMESGMFYIYLFENENLIKIGSNFVKVGTSTTSKCFILMDENENLYIFEKVLIKIENAKVDDLNDIEFISCNASNFTIFITKRNKTFIHYNNKITYLETPFENESKVIDLKAGSLHFIVLLENGNVYGLGDNSFGQSGQVLQKSSTFSPFILDNNNKTYGNIEKIFCNAASTILWTKNNYLICIGYTFNHFTMKHKYCHYQNVIILSLNDKLLYNNYLNTKKEGNEDEEYNDIACGGFYFLIYKKIKKLNNFGEIYFFKNLKKRSIELNDIEIKIN